MVNNAYHRRRGGGEGGLARCRKSKKSAKYLVVTTPFKSAPRPFYATEVDICEFQRGIGGRSLSTLINFPTSSLDS